MDKELAKILFWPFLVSFLIACLTTPLVIRLARPLGIIDDPKKRRHPAALHERPTPRGGGLSIFLAILLASLFFLPLDPRLAGILVGAGIVVLVGLWDDKKDLNPYLRLVSQFLASGVVVGAGIGIAFVSNPLGGIIDLSSPRIAYQFLGETKSLWILSAVFGLLWIVFLMNAVSWSSGVDGQLSGFVAISALVIAILSLRFSADITQWPVTILAVITFGAFLGFLPWHIYPQKIMPGFGGATLAGFMLAVLSILTTTKVGTLLVVLAIPVIDATYSITRRVLAGKSPVWPDRGHLHHRLLDAGWSKRRVAAAYWIATAVLGILALNLNTQAKFYTIIGVALVIGGILVWLTSFFPSQKPPGRGNG